MKIGIVGNYGHDNNGDEAILEGILTQLREEYGITENNIVLFSNHPQNTMSRYNIESYFLIKKEGAFIRSVLATLSQHFKEVRKLDVLIMGGGGVLMDMFKRDAPLYSTLVFLARVFGCKVIIYGVGAGPIRTFVGKNLIKGMIGASAITAVRDAESKNLLQSIGVDKTIEVIPDPALALGDASLKRRTQKIKRVGVTALPYYSSAYWPESDEDIYENYINDMAIGLDRAIDEHNVEITFFSTKYPQDIGATKDIYDKMKRKDSAIILEENLYPQELIKLSRDMDFVIGTRLHSLILSTAAGTPVIGVGYHPKVHSFMKRIEQLDTYISMEELADHSAFTRIMKMAGKRWNQVQEEYITLSSEMKRDTIQSRKLLGKILNNLKK
ncbi:polysaccharide pyruvyl transferase family protein [Rossellomorea aquimaris]|nr:polysaccharide pyruvyl transferase family protein [Rossellomorea vietnamensis]